MSTTSPLNVEAGQQRPGERIRAEVLSWPGVTEAPHQFGGLEFRFGRRELGHLHGDHLAELPFPTPVRDELLRQGRVHRHRFLPESGWISYPIRGQADVLGAIALFRLAYDRATRAAMSPAGREGRVMGDG